MAPITKLVSVIPRYKTAEAYMQTRAHSVLLLQRAVRTWICARREKRAKALARDEEDSSDQEEAAPLVL